MCILCFLAEESEKQKTKSNKVETGNERQRLTSSEGEKATEKGESVLYCVPYYTVYINHMSSVYLFIHYCMSG